MVSTINILIPSKIIEADQNSNLIYNSSLSYLMPITAQYMQAFRIKCENVLMKKEYTGIKIKP